MVNYVWHINRYNHDNKINMVKREDKQIGNLFYSYSNWNFKFNGCCKIIKGDFR
jgi:hypothetical protein